MRWTEEIMLVQEEMRRVCSYLSWYENWWSSRTDVGCMRQYDPFISEGITAYAEQQAHLRVNFRHFGRMLQHGLQVRKSLMVNAMLKRTMMTMTSLIFSQNIV